MRKTVKACENRGKWYVLAQADQMRTFSTNGMTNSGSREQIKKIGCGYCELLPSIVMHEGTISGTYYEFCNGEFRNRFGRMLEINLSSLMYPVPDF